MAAARPACYAWLGVGPVTDSFSLHNSRYDFNDEILPVGVSYWAALVETVLATWPAVWVWS